MKTLGFVGGGRITRILLKGLKNAGIQFRNIYVYETNEAVSSALKSEFPQIETSVTDYSKAASSDWLFLALHRTRTVRSIGGNQGFHWGKSPGDIPGTENHPC